jgi:hypothetical protein
MNTDQRKKKIEKYSLEVKLETLTKYDEIIREKRKIDVAKELGIHRTTLNTFLENRTAIENASTKENINNKRYRLRKSSLPLLERALYLWVTNVNQHPEKNILVEENNLKFAVNKFKSLLNITEDVTDGFLQRFRDRYAISMKNVFGESSTADFPSFEIWKNVNIKIIQNKFENRNILNFDETGFVYFLFFLFYI